MRWCVTVVSIMRHARLFLLCTLLLSLAGCRTPWVSSTIVNNSGETLHDVELSYPKATFGVTTIEAGKSYSHPFLVTSDGRLQLTFSDAQFKQHVAQGPMVRAKQSRNLNIVVRPDKSVAWQER